MALLQLACLLGSTPRGLQRIHEPDLLRRGLITVTSRGHELV